jgi:hypothetical protein
MHVFLDADGVITDFDSHVVSLSGKTPNELGEVALWEMVGSTPNFWLSMPLMPDAHRLMEFALQYEPTILTGCPRSGYEVAAEQKPIMLSRFFPSVPVITCLSRDKAQHMRQPGDVLLDDRHANIRRWEKAGGVAILFRGDVDRAIRDMTNAVSRGTQQ